MSEFLLNNFWIKKYCVDPHKKNIFIKPKKTTSPRSTKFEERKAKEREKRKNKIVKL